MTEQLILTKKDSRKIEGIKASVQDKIYINDTSIPIEEGDIFEYTNPAGVTSYLKVTKVLYYNHPTLGHIEIKYQKTKIFYRIYLDTNIVSRANDFRLKEEDARALRVISEKIDEQKIELFTSLKAKEEIEKIPKITQREFLLFICNLVKKVSNKNIIDHFSGEIGTVPVGLVPLGEGYSSEENPLFTSLKTLFDKDDAEHIFQAEKANMDFFLTLDKKSIIDRISQKPNEFRKIGLRVNIVLPVDILNILAARK